MINRGLFDRCNPQGERTSPRVLTVPVHRSPGSGDRQFLTAHQRHALGGSDKPSLTLSLRIGREFSAELPQVCCGLLACSQKAGDPFSSFIWTPVWSGGFSIMALTGRFPNCKFKH
jgi:hypothetical protein